MRAAFLQFHDPAWVYLAMPFIAALVSYGTKVVAIQMMFKPLEFKGVGPVGWQGQIPRRAAKMASIAVDSVTQGILEPAEIFDRIDIEAMIRELEVPLADSAELVLIEVLEAQEPGLWRSLPGAVQAAAIARVRGQVPDATRRMFGEFRENVDRFFDLKHMVVTNLTRDKTLLNKMFEEMAAPEFRFIARSGVVTGFAVGMVQVISYGASGEHLVLPFFGLLAGGLTDYLALTMIFRPKKRRTIVWPFHWQGLFHKRRDEVSLIYADLMADDILSPRAMIESMLNGPASDRVIETVSVEVQALVDRQVGPVRPLVQISLGSERYRRLKQDVADRVIDRLPESAMIFEAFLARSLDLRSLVAERLMLLETDDYENLLRPAFKDDEWVIVAVGATLGFLVGELQVQVILNLL